MSGKNLKSKLDDILEESYRKLEVGVVVVCSPLIYSEFIRNYSSNDFIQWHMNLITDKEIVRSGLYATYKNMSIFVSSKMLDVDIDFLVLKNESLKRFGLFRDTHGRAGINRWWDADREHIQGLIDSIIMHRALK